ncbi:hypothetical protein FA13DRAFT_1777262 [Coprinellus micaceus]|uniref:Uncharacterized protein n=1 Tax=Coprinellus micaceus TaxID=71717 RepID=A0A4Y7SVG7_COPMI|nr:hypothetical protein FA13DRAFT_1777262 [Coprinellus micaceus]
MATFAQLEVPASPSLPFPALLDDPQPRLFPFKFVEFRIPPFSIDSLIWATPRRHSSFDKLCGYGRLQCGNMTVDTKGGMMGQQGIIASKDSTCLELAQRWAEMHYIVFLEPSPSSPTRLPYQEPLGVSTTMDFRRFGDVGKTGLTAALLLPLVIPIFELYAAMRGNVGTLRAFAYAALGARSCLPWVISKVQGHASCRGRMTPGGFLRRDFVGFSLISLSTRPTPTGTTAYIKPLDVPPWDWGLEGEIK